MTDLIDKIQDFESFEDLAELISEPLDYEPVLTNEDLDSYEFLDVPKIKEIQYTPEIQDILKKPVKQRKYNPSFWKPSSYVEYKTPQKQNTSIAVNYNLNPKLRKYWQPSKYVTDFSKNPDNPKTILKKEEADAKPKMSFFRKICTALW